MKYVPCPLEGAAGVHVYIGACHACPWGGLTTTSSVVPQILSIFTFSQGCSPASHTQSRLGRVTSRPWAVPASQPLGLKVHITMPSFYHMNSQGQSHFTNWASHQSMLCSNPEEQQSSECTNLGYYQFRITLARQKVTDKHWDLIPNDVSTHKITETKYGISHHKNVFHVFDSFPGFTLNTFNFVKSTLSVH